MRQLANLLHCRNEAVATYAAATMHRLTDQKSEEEKKRMSVNLQQSLFHHNNVGSGEGYISTGFLGLNLLKNFVQTKPVNFSDKKTKTLPP